MDETFLALQRALAGEYSLEREIGRGGMGIVYLAREVQLDRLVAIKVLPATLAARDDIRDRFTREARTAASLSHPNIVPIHRVGEAAGLPYFVMTYVRGETLGERLRTRGPLAASAITRVMHDVALALGYSHGRGIVHRDVKPDNILLEEESGRALVTDFGIAYLRARDAADDNVLGTVQFMSPEQARGAALDARSDIYSLGVVAFLSITGKLPHDEPTPSRTLARIATTPAPPLSTGGAAVPAGLARTVDRCLAFEAADRFTTAEEIATAIDALTAPVRVPVPAIIREWTSTPAPLLQAYAFWSGGWTIVAVNEFMSMSRRIPVDTPMKKVFLAASIASAPLVIITVFQLQKTYRALAAGYDIADLRAALRSWIDARRQELREMPEERLGIRLLRSVPYLIALWVPAAIITMEYTYGFYSPRWIGTLLRSITFIGIGALAAVAGFGIPFISPRVEARMAGRLRSALWNGRFGKWLADRLTPANRGVPETQFRPTELALKVAVNDLYETLPKAFRDMVGDLPPIASRLSDHVASLRREVEDLQVLRSQARGDEAQAVESMLASSRKQLGETVGALERMRLELLRLHGGARDTRPLTTSLDAARLMVEDIVRLREADAELSPGRRRLPLDFRTPTPA